MDSNSARIPLSPYFDFMRKLCSRRNCQRFLTKLMLLALSSLTLPSMAQNLLEDVKIAGSVDMIHPFNFDSPSKNTLQVRSVELMAFGAIDQTFDGWIDFAGHYDEGQFHFELHEAYISSSKIFPGLEFKVGKYFLNLGRLNRFHQHDWVLSMAPKSHREFFVPGGEDSLGAEGVADTGIEASYILPTEHFYQITLGATNGQCYGHCETLGEKPPRPLMYLRPTTMFLGSPQGGLLIGATFLNREDAAKTETQLFGVDATYKKREGKTLKWLVQSEVQYQEQTPLTEERSQKLGGYIFTQYGQDQMYYGLRVDGFSHLNKKFSGTTQDQDDLDYGLTAQVEYQNSEFSKFRVSYIHEIDTTESLPDVKDRMVLLQWVYHLGAHPVHDF